MAWKKFTPPASPLMADTVSLTIPEDNKRGAPTLNIDVATLKELGWKDGTSLQLLIGEGEHLGQIRIEPAIGEPARLAMPSGKGKRKRGRVSLGRMPCLSEEGLRRPVPHEVVKGEKPGANYLVVTIPEEARSHQMPRGTIAAVARASR